MISKIVRLIHEGVTDYTETDPCPGFELMLNQRLSDVGVDSLGVIMVTVHVAKGMGLDLSTIVVLAGSIGGR